MQVGAAIVSSPEICRGGVERGSDLSDQRPCDSTLAALVASVLLGAAALPSSGCAAVFRESEPAVHVVSDPPGGEVLIKGRAVSTPADVKISRGGMTELVVTMPGFEEHHGTVRKRMN